MDSQEFTYSHICQSNINKFRYSHCIPLEIIVKHSISHKYSILRKNHGIPMKLLYI